MDMKEVFRDQDITRVSYYQSVLEAEGFSSFVKNQDTTMVTAAMPATEFYPVLCVTNDEESDAAKEVLRSHFEKDAVLSQREVQCPNCKEFNPANFELCWSCSTALSSVPSS
jgi:hypothetical protein